LRSSSERGAPLATDDPQDRILKGAPVDAESKKFAWLATDDPQDRILKV